MKKTRIVIIALLMALLVSLCGISASASTHLDEGGGNLTTDISENAEYSITEDAGGIEEGDGESLSDREIGGATGENEPEQNGDGGDAEGGDESENENPGDEVEENAFSVFFEGVKTYATEILSALTLIASLVLAYAYKSGLTPVITNALTNLGKLLAGIRDSASENERMSKEITSAIGERLEAAEATVAKLTESIEAVTENLKREEESAKEKKKLSLVLEAQIDMMYSLFISSALPEYQKTAVAEKIEKMKEAIADAEK